jgi:hypothetical protein
VTRGSWLTLTYIAQSTGAALVAEPVTRWPWFLVQAMQRGMQVASWMENLPTEEQPPQEIWHHQERLKEWFERIKGERERKYSSNPQDDWEPVPGTETIEFDVSDDVKSLRGY